MTNQCQKNACDSRDSPQQQCRWWCRERLPQPSELANLCSDLLRTVKSFGQSFSPASLRASQSTSRQPRHLMLAISVSRQKVPVATGWAVVVVLPPIWVNCRNISANSLVSVAGVGSLPSSALLANGQGAYSMKLHAGFMYRDSS